MQTPWAKPIQKTGILKVYNGAPGHWLSVFSNAIDSFNSLSHKHSLGMKPTRLEVKA